MELAPIRLLCLLSPSGLGGRPMALWAMFRETTRGLSLAPMVRAPSWILSSPLPFVLCAKL
jgi:hypothetical protein